MFDAPLDATYAWLGVALVSVVTAGVAISIPASPPPAAGDVAYTIDSVADGDHPATAEHGLSAERIKLTTGTIALSTGGDTARVTLVADRITPVLPIEDGVTDELRRVLEGAPPDHVFADPHAFATAAERARIEPDEWHPAPSRLIVRQVHYGGVDVTLVG